MDIEHVPSLSPQPQVVATSSPHHHPPTHTEEEPPRRSLEVYLYIYKVLHRPDVSMHVYRWL